MFEFLIKATINDGWVFNANELFYLTFCFHFERYIVTSISFRQAEVANASYK